jgi:DNA (cytosine-5)-methyltransferase 1
MWVEMARIIREVGPRFVFVENSPMLTSRGLGRVLGDLAEMGYDARWGVLSSYSADGDIDGSRIWIVAEAMRFRTSRLVKGGSLGKIRQGGARCKKSVRLRYESRIGEPFGGNGMPPMLCRGVDEVADRVDRLKATGNGQDAILAALAWEILTAETNQ